MVEEETHFILYFDDINFDSDLDSDLDSDIDITQFKSNKPNNDQNSNESNSYDSDFELYIAENDSKEYSETTWSANHNNDGNDNDSNKYVDIKKMYSEDDNEQNNIADDEFYIELDKCIIKKIPQNGIKKCKNLDDEIDNKINKFVDDYLKKVYSDVISKIEKLK
jgi:catalase